MSGKTRAVNGCDGRSVKPRGPVTARKCYLPAQFPRIAAGRGMKRAVMSVAHSMLVIVYTILKTDRAYHELGGTYLEQINKDQLQRYYVKRLQRLGLTVTVQPVA